MSPCNAYRSFAISLVIVFTRIESPTSGFAIRATLGIPDDQDLTGAESSVLTVRHENRRPNDINTGQNGKEDSKEKFNHERKQNSFEFSTDGLIDKITEYTAGSISNLDDFNRKLMSSKIPVVFDSTKHAETDNRTEGPLKSFHLTTVSTAEDLYANNNESTQTTAGLQPATTEKTLQTEVVNTTERHLLTEHMIYSTDYSRSTPSYETSTPKYSFTKLKTFQLTKDLTAITLSVDELYSLRDLASSITEPIPSEIASFQENKAVKTDFNTQTIPAVSNANTEINAGSYTTNHNQEGLDESASTSSAGSIKLSSEPAKNTNTDTVTTLENNELLWKTHISIARKPITTDADVPVTTEVIGNTETSQATFSLDETSSVNPSTISETFRNDITTINDQLLTTINEYISDTERDYTPYEATTTIKPFKIGVAHSKMAGFLDLSKSSSSDVVAVPIFETVENTNNSEAASVGQDLDTLNNETLHNKTEATGSQSQLADDMIKEELLKEELLNDNEEAKRYRENRSDIVNQFHEVQPLAADVISINNLADNQTESTLNVQPISHEKIKNTILYVVSPNYRKPMKKIDVQPPKQFVRDPDDNSWRNEGISSLGIVFKAKNSSKSFKQVLKNKTEIELNNLSDKDNKSGVLDLRQRLEKIAEKRKSKKKKINKYGDTVYIDYEEGNASSEVVGLRKENRTSTTISFMDTIFTTTPTTTDLTITTEKNTDTTKTEQSSTTEEIQDVFKRFELEELITEKPKKLYNIAEYYDTTDEYDADYYNMSNIDLKKYTMAATEKTTLPTTTQTPQSVYLQDRKPTVQYFPPLTTKKVKVNVNDYDEAFRKNVNLYAVEVIPKDEHKALTPASFDTMSTPPTHTEQFEEITSTPAGSPSKEYNKNLYYPDSGRVTESLNAFMNEPDLNRGSYVIKHYKDFLNVAARDDDYKNEYSAFTDPPVKGVTVNEFTKEDIAKPDDYDYEQQFRKDLLNRFVANFNQNNERFKVDFPILFNNSVVHKKFDENGKVLASSSAFMKRLYDSATTKSEPYTLGKPCEVNCDNAAVELSPEYELQYYVPDQEEKEEVVQPATGAYHQYRS